MGCLSAHCAYYRKSYNYTKWCESRSRATQIIFTLLMYQKHIVLQCVQLPNCLIPFCHYSDKIWSNLSVKFGSWRSIVQAGGFGVLSGNYPTFDPDRQPATTAATSAQRRSIVFCASRSSSQCFLSNLRGFPPGSVPSCEQCSSIGDGGKARMPWL